MAQEGGGMTVSKLVVIIMALLLLVLIAVGAYNGWLVNGIQKMGSQMDKILIFFNQKGETTDGELCLDKIDITIKNKIKGSLEICPNQCELTLNEKIGTSSKFKINTTGTYKYLEGTGVGEFIIKGLKEGWNLIEITDPEEIKKEVEASENFNILLNTLENFLKEINPETIEEFENVCNSNEECPTGYYCDEKTNINPSYCQQYQIESLENGDKLIKEVKGSVETGLFHLDSKGKISYSIYKDIPIGIINSEGKITFDREEYPLACNTYKGEDKILCNVLKNNYYLRIENCYFKEKELEYFNNLKEKQFREIQILEESISKYNLLIQKLKLFREVETSKEVLNQILNVEPIYYVYVDQRKGGVLYKNLGDKWYIKGDTKDFKIIEVQLFDNWGPAYLVSISRKSGGTFTFSSSNPVKIGPLTKDNNLILNDLNYGVVYARKGSFEKGKDNTEDFRQILENYITQNKEKTEERKKNFEEFYKLDSENNLGEAYLTDGRIIFTLDNKYGITKKESIDILEITDEYLEYYIKRENNWEKINSETIIELKKELNNLKEVQEEKIIYNKCKKIEVKSILNKIFSQNDIYYIFVNNYNHNPQALERYLYGTLFKKEGEIWYKNVLYRDEKDRKWDDLKNKKIYDMALEISRLSTGGFLTGGKIYSPESSVTIGRLTGSLNSPQKIQDGIYFDIVNDYNIEEFYDSLYSNIIQNEKEKRIIDQLFKDYISKQEKKLEIFEYNDERKILTINNKYGISKDINIDVLGINSQYLKMFELKNGFWEEIDIEDKSYHMTDSEIEELKNQKENTNSIIDYLNERCW